MTLDLNDLLILLGIALLLYGAWLLGIAVLALVGGGLLLGVGLARARRPKPLRRMDA